jgi:acyl transferase domain-containing protein/acyl carrier protein
MPAEGQAMPAATGREIAVIGMAGRFPGARDLRQFWSNLAAGRDAVTFLSAAELEAAGVPAARLANRHYVRAASLLDGVEEFDAPFFGYTAREAEILDPQQRLFLEHAWEALEDAGHAPATYDGLIGVYAGVAWNTYLLNNLTTRLDLFEDGGFQVFVASDKDFLPTRLSYKLNLRGPSLVVQTSCSTSLVAVHLACLSLLNYECDLALAGGVTVKVPQREGYLHLDGGLASPDGSCRAFDAAAAGTIFGSGAGVVVLKRLAEALAGGDTIRAVIKGSAVNNDGSLKVSYTAPSVEGQAEVIAAAQAIADVEPDTLGYVEAHGTGTALGDPIEVAALTKVFRERTSRRGFCALGSVKSNVGHLDAAAGIAGFIKTVLALEHRAIPPSLHCERPNPAIDFAASPFRVSTDLTAWEDAAGPRRAAVSSFGVGGTNAHVILEEAPPAAGAAAGAPARPWQLLLLSARSAAALETATAALADHLAGAPAASLPDVAYTLQAGRTVFRHRRALVCRDAADAVSALRSGGPARLIGGADVDDPRDRPVVFLFPGQGAQYVGMGRELLGEPVFAAEIDRCAELLRPALGLDLRTILYPGPAEREAAAGELARTSLTQPVLFACEYALAQLWMAWGVRPAALLGHSLGEIVAACLAGVMSLEDALSLVALRGRLMQALPAGAMLGVPLGAAAVGPLLPPEVTVAAENEPSRCVVSGPSSAVEELRRRLEADGVDCRRLHTSHAFHSPMMEPALAPFAAAVGKVRLAAPAIPFLSNPSGTWITPRQATDPEYWARHLRQPVRFAAAVEEVLADPRRILLEVGPGRTLGTLAGRHPARQGQPVIRSLPGPAEAGAQPADAAMLEALGRLWLAGLRLDAGALFAGQSRRRVPLPTYPFERQRYWIEPLPRAAAAGASTAARTGDDGRGAPAATRAPGAAADGSDVLAPLAKLPEIDDWFYLPAWRPALAAAPPAAGMAPRRWLILAAASGLGARWAAWLGRRGDAVVLAVPGAELRPLPRPPAPLRAAFSLPAGSPDACRDLLEQLRAASLFPEAVVHAWTCDEGPRDEAPVTTAEAFEAAQERGLYSLLGLAQALARAGAAAVPLKLALLSHQLAGLHAAEPLRPERAPMLALCRVIGQEHPEIRCLALDVEPSPAPAQEERLLERLTAEVSAETGPEVAAYRGGERYLQRPQPVRLAPAAPGASPAPLRAGGAYLMTGGLAGDGFRIAGYLARAAAVRLALLESGPPAPAAAQRLAELRQLGAEAWVLECDLTDPAAVAAAVERAELSCGPLHGVIHAAGRSGEESFRLLRDLDAAECREHFAARAHPLLALAAALAGRKLDFRLALSSLATVVGGAAYGAATAADLFVEAFAADRGRHGQDGWCALAWDPAAEGDAAAADPARAGLARLAMTPAEGEEVLRRVLAAAHAAGGGAGGGAACSQLLVSTADLEARLAAHRRRTAAWRAAAVPAGPGRELHPRPLDTPYVPPETDLEERVAAVWRHALGFAEIGVHDNFFELGGDSFVAIRVVAALGESLGVELPVARLYQGLTVRELAKLLPAAAGGEEAAAARAVQLESRRRGMRRRKEVQQLRRSLREQEVV